MSTRFSQLWRSTQSNTSGPSPSRLVTRFFVVVAVLHLPSWAMALIFDGPRVAERPLFNLDLLAAATVSCISPIGGVLILLAAWAAEILRAASIQYHFISPLDFVDAARFLDMLNVRTFVSISSVASLVFLAACGVFVLSQTHQCRILALPLSLSLVCAASLDIVNGSFRGFGLDKDSRIIPLNFAGSPMWNVWVASKRNLSSYGPPEAAPQALAFKALQDWQVAHPEGSSLLVLVESMGLPTDPEIAAWLRARLVSGQVQARWAVSQAAERFIGSTTWGELRTLCGLQGHYSRLNEDAVKNCLPQRLKAQGVQSVGIHGFSLRMFDRNEWWPRIGLMPMKMPSPVVADVPKNCNLAFPGVCDAAVITMAVKQAQEPAHFVYVLTLDTHLPIDEQRGQLMPARLEELCKLAAMPNEGCKLVQELGKVLALLGQSLAQSSASPFVVVVGDHAPPFGQASNRRAFASDRVLLFIMEPR